MPDFRFSLGDHVQSPKVGRCAPFIGEVVFVRHVPECRTFAAHNYYHVRAPDGADWCRQETELTDAPRR